MEKPSGFSVSNDNVLARNLSPPIQDHIAEQARPGFKIPWRGVCGAGGGDD